MGNLVYLLWKIFDCRPFDLIDWCGSCGFNFYNFPFLNSPHLLYCVLLMVCQYCTCDRLSGNGHGMNWFPLSYQLFLTMCMGKQGRRLITWAILWWAMSIIIILSTPSKLHMLQFESKTYSLFLDLQKSFAMLWIILLS